MNLISDLKSFLSTAPDLGYISPRVCDTGPAGSTPGLRRPQGTAWTVGCLGSVSATRKHC